MSKYKNSDVVLKDVNKSELIPELIRAYLYTGHCSVLIKRIRQGLLDFVNEANDEDDKTIAAFTAEQCLLFEKTISDKEDEVWNVSDKVILQEIQDLVNGEKVNE